MANFQEKIKNFDINSLSKINLNIDVNMITKILQKRTDFLINTLLVLATIFAIYYSYTFNNSKTDAMKQELADLEEKKTAASDLEKKQAKLDEFKKKVPQGLKTETEIIKKILELAELNGVTVVFYTPTALKEEKGYSIQAVDFIFESSFAQMIMLLRAIERNKENLRVTYWKNETTGQEGQRFGNKKPAQNDNNIKWRISVSSTLLNYEK